MYLPNIDSALSLINPISLDEMISVPLMNRTDTKFVFSVSRLPDLINLIDGRYRVLEIDHLRTFPYNTTYLDTPEYLFYNQHITGKLERHKIRYRRYETTGTSFLEIKKKTNKRRTIKYRIENNLLQGSFDDPAVNFINEHSPINSMLIKPVLINRFTRATLIRLESKERITIDFNISFTELTNGEQIEMPYLTIVELKKESGTAFSPFNNLIKQLGIYPTGFSKYCIGNAILNDVLRKNRIKPKLLLLKKIENEYIRSFGN